MQAIGTPYPPPYMSEQPSNRMPVTDPAMPSAFNAYTGVLMFPDIGTYCGAVHGHHA